MSGLIYNGGGFMVGVPARNLSEEEARLFGEKRLLDSGLYSKPAKAKPQPAENKIAAGPQENKGEVKDGRN